MCVKPDFQLPTSVLLPASPAACAANIPPTAAVFDTLRSASDPFSAHLTQHNLT